MADTPRRAGTKASYPGYAHTLHRAQAAMQLMEARKCPKPIRNADCGSEIWLSAGTVLRAQSITISIGGSFPNLTVMS